MLQVESKEEKIKYWELSVKVRQFKLSWLWENWCKMENLFKMLHILMILFEAVEKYSLFFENAI